MKKRLVSKLIVYTCLVLSIMLMSKCGREDEGTSLTGYMLKGNHKIDTLYISEDRRNILFTWENNSGDLRTSILSTSEVRFIESRSIKYTFARFRWRPCWHHPSYRSDIHHIMEKHVDRMDVYCKPNRYFEIKKFCR